MPHRQHRNAFFLILNTVAGTATGVLFWVLIVRAAHLSPPQVGVGYAIVALCTTVGLLAKGGLDTALLRFVPRTGKAEGGRLLRFAAAVAAVGALGLTAIVAVVGRRVLPPTPPGVWALVALGGALLAITWLQDAYFLAVGDAAFSFRRNLVLCGARLAFPIAVVALGIPQPVAVSWCLAILVSALAALGFQRRLPERAGSPVPRRTLLRSAARNLSGSAAEFLPGLLLAPLVLAVDGAAAAAYFGMAWMAAAALFLLASSCARSATVEMVSDPASTRHSLARALRVEAIVLLPLALIGAATAPWTLSVLGTAYAVAGAVPMAILCLSAIAVAPIHLYLALLRAREVALPLILFPAAMIVFLFILAPPLGARWGLTGIAVAWAVTNVPFAIYGSVALAREWRRAPRPRREVIPRAQPPTLSGRAKLE
ncbi:MAG: lipopolysaccharide biosynthesis protein [Thermoplasmatota archaeon]